MSVNTHLTDSAFPNLELNIRDVLRALGKDANVDRYSVNYCLRRLDKEGFPFVSRLLPAFSKSILQSLEKGWLDVPLGFRLDSRGFPRLLKGQLLRLFTPHGHLRPEPDPQALYEIRMFCESFYKTDVPFNEQQIADAKVKYLETEAANRKLKVDFRLCERIANHVQWACEGFGPLIDALADNCRFGPGANSNISSSEYKQANKGSKRKLSASLRKILNGKSTCHPLMKRLRPLVSEFSNEYTKRWFGRVGVRGKPSSISKVIFVPKDSRGPRTISSEPTDLSWVQMGFFDAFTKHLESRTSGRIQFRDQRVNQRLAYSGSLPGKSRSEKLTAPCTGDLRDASDRVSTKLVGGLFRRTKLIPFLLDARSEFTLLSFPHYERHFDLLIADCLSFAKSGRSLFSTRVGLRFLVPALTRLLFVVSRYAEACKRLHRLDRIVDLLAETSACFHSSSGGSMNYILRLSKFGGMGSGLTFPVMALIIWATCVEAIVRIYGVPRERARKLVYVYGDDFIVPKRFFASCCRNLEAVGLAVNYAKSYVRGEFRESCGHDYYRGVFVTPQNMKLSGCDAGYLHSLRSLKFERNVLAVYKLNRLAHEYDKREFLHTCELLYSLTRSAVEFAHPGVTFPYVTPGVNVLGTASTDPLKMNDLFGHSVYEQNGLGTIPKCVVFKTQDVRFPSNAGSGSEWLFYHSLPNGSAPISTDQVISDTPNFLCGVLSDNRDEGFVSSLDRLFPLPNSKTQFKFRNEFYFEIRNVSHMSVS